MPKTKNSIARFKVLDEQLSRAYYIPMTIGDLTSNCTKKLAEQGLPQVGLRCIQKDLKFLAGAPFDAPIERYSIGGRRCLRYSDPSFTIFTKKLSDEEKSLLREVLGTLGQFDGLPNFEWLDRFKKDLGLKEGRKVISFSNNPDYAAEPGLLGKLFNFISSEQTIALKYQPFNASEISCVVYPYLLKEYNNRWFLLCATSNNTGKIFNFPLDRIKAVKPLPGEAFVPCQPDLEEHFYDIVGVTLYDDRPVDHILIWVDDGTRGYVDTKPIHPSQTEIKGTHAAQLRNQYPMLTGGTFYTLDCIRNKELTRELTAYGAGLLVLRDTDGLLADIHDRLAAMQQEYAMLPTACPPSAGSPAK